MMQSLNSDVWIKGWFDGDYNDNDNPAIGQQSQLDTKATRVNIIRKKNYVPQNISTFVWWFRGPN